MSNTPSVVGGFSIYIYIYIYVYIHTQHCSLAFVGVRNSHIQLSTVGKIARPANNGPSQVKRVCHFCLLYRQVRIHLERHDEMGRSIWVQFFDLSPCGINRNPCNYGSPAPLSVSWPVPMVCFFNVMM